MCLIIPKGGSIQVAERDITTYKQVYKYTYHWEPVFNSGKFDYYKPLTPFDTLGNPIKHLRVTKVTWFILSYNKIEEGFHSNVKKSSYNTSNVICIIPRGAEYCIGTRGDIVSTKLIVFKDKFDYLRYKLWHR